MESPLHITSQFKSRDYGTEPRLYSTNILLIDSSVATHPQLEDAISSFFHQAKKKFPALKEGWIINAVPGPGFTYMWVKDVGLFHLLLGKNLDGSPRETIDIVPLPLALENREISWLKESGEKKRWSEFAEEEEQLEEEKERASKIKTTLPPFFPSPIIQFTADQTAELILKHGLKDVKNHTLIFSVAHLSLDDHKYACNKLWCSNVPDTISDQQIKTFFAPFSSSKRARVRLESNSSGGEKNYKEDTYPIVYSDYHQGKGKRSLTVEFDYNNRAADARWAKLFSKISLKGKDGKNIVLFFSTK